MVVNRPTKCRAAKTVWILDLAVDVSILRDDDATIERRKQTCASKQAETVDAESIFDFCLAFAGSR